MLVACRAEYGRCEMRAWLLVVAASLLLVVVVVARQRDPLRRARLLKRAGLGVMAVVTALFGLVVAAEMFTDPGGWTALGLVAAWAVLLVILAAMAWYRPEGATRLFAVLIAAVIGVSVWFAANPEDWRGFEDRHGPIRAILSLVLAAAVALLGVKRTAAAGVLLLVLGVVPVVVSGLGSPLGLASLAVVSSAAVIAGVLYLSSAALTNPSVPPTLAAAWPQHGHGGAPVESTGTQREHN
jgi:hypothetical protein